MESSEAKQRIKDQPEPSIKDQPEPSPDSSQKITSRSKRAKKVAMARKGLRSQGLAIGLPLLLTALTIYLFQLGQGYDELVISAWYPPIWLIHLAALLSSSLMGLFAWLVWAEGGLRQPANAFPLFVTPLFLGLMWGPVVFVMGASRLGLVVGLVLVAALYGCLMGFREVNPIAADLVKPCIAWAVLLVIMSFALI